MIHSNVFSGSSSLLVGTKIMYCINNHNDYCCVYIHRCLKIRDNIRTMAIDLAICVLKDTCEFRSSNNFNIFL